MDSTSISLVSAKTVGNKYMKLFILLSLLSLVIVKEVSCTHLEICESHVIKENLNGAIEQAMVLLESNLTFKINRSITRINVTNNAVISRLRDRV